MIHYPMQAVFLYMFHICSQLWFLILIINEQVQHWFSLRKLSSTFEGERLKHG